MAAAPPCLGIDHRLLVQLSVCAGVQSMVSLSIRLCIFFSHTAVFFSFLVARLCVAVSFRRDRIKELIKYKGHQVAPAELEAVLLSHPDVLDAAVVGIPAPEASNGEVPRAFVVLKDVTIAPSATSIQAYVDERVNPFMRLRGGLEIIDKIPKSAAGKLLRRVLTERALADHTTRLENQK